jgi:uncharacterized protein YfdQ (DUF2303 family)
MNTESQATNEVPVQEAKIAAQSTLNEVASYLSLLREPTRYVNHNLPFVIIPQEMKVHDIEQLLPAPARIRKHVTVEDVESFIIYFNKFKDVSTPFVTYNRERGTQPGFDSYLLQCVFDYHSVFLGRDEEGTVKAYAPQPQWGGHKLTLPFLYDDQFLPWIKGNSQWMTQEAFAEFVEDNLSVFHNPDAATMLEIAQGLIGNRGVTWESGKRLSNGQVRFVYKEEIQARTTNGEIAVPERIAIHVPIFKGSTPIPLQVAFRWRLSREGEVTFMLKLQQPNLAIQAAANQIMDTAKQSLTLDIINSSR